MLAGLSVEFVDTTELLYLSRRASVIFWPDITLVPVTYIFDKKLPSRCVTVSVWLDDGCTADIGIQCFRYSTCQLAPMIQGAMVINLRAFVRGFVFPSLMMALLWFGL